jgi:hypothetical protein
VERADVALAGPDHDAQLGVVVAAWVAISGRSVHRFLQPLATGRLAIVACVVILAGWGWKLAVMKGLFA